MAVRAARTFSPTLNQEAIRYFRLGRHALLAGLKLLQLRAGDAVLVPAFICRDLLAPIHAAGAQPVFYEVDRQLRPAAPSDVQNARAVLAVNYFGFPQDLSSFRVYCEQRGAALIEDNAHGFLSCDETGAALGSRGDLGVFSIRKTFSLPDGAALLANKPEWQARLAQQLPCRNHPLPAGYWVKRGLARIQRETGAPFLAMGQDLARNLRRWRTGFDVAPSLPESEYTMPLDAAPHCYTMAALQCLDVADETARRRKLYGEFHALLANLDVEPVFGELTAGTVPYGYPFYADDHTALTVAKLARKRGLDCVRWPDLPAAVVSTAPTYYRSVWLVNFLC